MNHVVTLLSPDTHQSYTLNIHSCIFITILSLACDITNYLYHHIKAVCVSTSVSYVNTGKMVRHKVVLPVLS
jgi:hypothetical protein